MKPIVAIVKSDGHHHGVLNALGLLEDKLEKEFGVSASSGCFKLVQAMIGSSVQVALGASGARAAAVDPELSDLVRREQDALKQINAFQAMLSNSIA